jgi:hypothetical protein
MRTSACHRSVQQQFRVLRNYGTRPGLSRLAMLAKRERGGQFSPWRHGGSVGRHGGSVGRHGGSVGRHGGSVVARLTVVL